MVKIQMQRFLLIAVAISLILVPRAAAWTWPADGDVLKPFVFDPGHPYAAGQHRGVDIAGAAGADARAPVAGAVTFAGSVPSGGKTVTIQTQDGYSVTLVHLGSISAVRGAVVAEGASIGSVGASGDAEWPEAYLHMGVRLTAEQQGYLDPLSFLPPRSSSIASPAPAPDEAVTTVSTAPTPPLLVDSVTAPVDAQPADGGASATETQAAGVSTPPAGSAPGDASAQPESTPAEASVPADDAPSVGVDAGLEGAEVSVGTAVEASSTGISEGGAVVAGSADAPLTTDQASSSGETATNAAPLAEAAQAQAVDAATGAGAAAPEPAPTSGVEVPTAETATPPQTAATGTLELPPVAGPETQAAPAQVESAQKVEATPSVGTGAPSAPPAQQTPVLPAEEPVEPAPPSATVESPTEQRPSAVGAARDPGRPADAVGEAAPWTPRVESVLGAGALSTADKAALDWSVGPQSLRREPLDGPRTPVATPRPARVPTLRAEVRHSGSTGFDLAQTHGAANGSRVATPPTRAEATLLSPAERVTRGAVVGRSSGTRFPFALVLGAALAAFAALLGGGSVRVRRRPNPAGEGGHEHVAAAAEHDPAVELERNGGGFVEALRWRNVLVVPPRAHTRRRCMALRGRTSSHRPCGRLRSVGRLRPLPQTARQRRADGFRDRRARDSRDGRRRSRRRVAA